METMLYRVGVAVVAGVLALVFADWAGDGYQRRKADRMADPASTVVAPPAGDPAVEAAAAPAEEAAPGEEAAPAGDPAVEVAAAPAEEAAPGEETAPVDEAAAAPATPAEPPAAEGPVVVGGVTGDPARGARIFGQCAACHYVDDTGRHKYGPNLKGVVGSKVAAMTGYRYSKAMQAKDGRWTIETLAAYLADPRGVVTGTKMVFSGLKDPQDRADIIAYLTQADAAR